MIWIRSNPPTFAKKFESVAIPFQNFSLEEFLGVKGITCCWAITSLAFKTQFMLDLFPCKKISYSRYTLNRRLNSTFILKFEQIASNWQEHWTQILWIVHKRCITAQPLCTHGNVHTYVTIDRKLSLPLHVILKLQSELKKHSNVPSSLTHYQEFFFRFTQV